MHLMYRSYFANYKNFPEAAIKFKQISRISSRHFNFQEISGVGDTLIK